MTLRISVALVLLAAVTACSAPPPSVTTLPAMIEPSKRVTLPESVTAFAAADGALTIGLRDGGVARWKVGDAAPTLLKAHGARVLAIRAERSGAELVSVSEKGDVSRTDVTTGATSSVSHADFGGLDDIRAAAFSPDGTNLAVGTGLGAIVIFDVATGAKRHTLAGHRGEINTFAFQRGSQTMASTSADADVRLWDITAGREFRAFDNDTNNLDVAFSPASGALAWGGTNRRVSLRNPSGWDETGTFAVAAPWFVIGLAWSPDGTRLTVATIDDSSLTKGEIHVVDAATRQRVTMLNTGGQPAWWTGFVAADVVASVVGDRDLVTWNVPTASADPRSDR